MPVLDFVVLGLAHCFARDPEGLLTPILLIEPVPSAAFLALLHDVPSSFSFVMAIDPSNLLKGELVRPQGFPQEALFPDDFHERLLAAARTFNHNPMAKEHLTIGMVLKLDKSPKEKRVINQLNFVSEQDNIKQHPLSHQVL